MTERIGMATFVVGLLGGLLIGAAVGYFGSNCVDDMMPYDSWEKLDDFRQSISDFIVPDSLRPALHPNPPAPAAYRRPKSC